VLHSNNEYIYMGTYGRGIYRSSDDGDTWEPSPNSGLIIDVAYDIVTIGGDLIASTYGDGIYVSHDNGDSWSESNDGLPSMGRYIEGLAANATHVIATTYDGIYRSSNAGKQWTKVESGFGGTINQSVVNIGNDFYIGTGINGIWRSTDNGATWDSVNAGLRTPSVSDIVQLGGDLFLGTYGSGVWRRPFVQLSVGAESETLHADAIVVHPNPAVSTITLAYYLNTRTSVTISIYDALGRIMAQPVVDALQETGEHEITLATDQLVPGVYHCSVMMEKGTQSARFVVR
jgi:photosystem II stability/assembly factor-like uncharacterized protein